MVCTRAKHKTYSPLDDHWVILSSSKAFDYFRTRRDEIRCVFDLKNYLGQMYPTELGIKDTLESNTFLPTWIWSSIGRGGQLRTSLFDKRDINVNITTFYLRSSNTQSSPAYGIFISQLIRYARTCSSYAYQNRSTEGCSKLKRSVDLTSSGKNGLNIRTNASPKWNRTRCPEE